METLEILLSALSLPNPKKPPSAFCKVSILRNNSWIVLYTTETIPSNKDPKWSFAHYLHSDFVCDAFLFEVGTSEEQIGAVEVLTADLWSNRSLTKALAPSSSRLCINTLKGPMNEGVIHLKLGGQNFKTKLLGSSSFYLKIYRYIDFGCFLQVYQTPAVAGVKNPEWEEFEIPIRTLCNLDLDHLIKICLLYTSPSPRDS